MMTVLEIIRQPKYFGLAITVFLAVIAFAAWLPNLHLISRTINNANLSWWQKTNLLGSLLGSLRTNFTPWSRGVMMVSAALAGIQVSLLAYYFRQSIKLQQSMGVSVLGLATSMLGVGCASCGSVILTSLIGFGSATILTGILPFHGQEFGLIGVGFLLLAIYATINKINSPLVCGVNAKEKTNHGLS